MTFVWDPHTNTWTRLADAPYVGQTGTAAIWTGQQLLLWGEMYRSRDATSPAGHFDTIAISFRQNGAECATYPATQPGHRALLCTGIARSRSSGQERDHAVGSAVQRIPLQPAVTTTHPCLGGGDRQDSLQRA